MKFDNGIGPSELTATFSAWAQGGMSPPKSATALPRCATISATFGRTLASLFWQYSMDETL